MQQSYSSYPLIEQLRVSFAASVNLCHVTSFPFNCPTASRFFSIRIVHGSLNLLIFNFAKFST